MDMTDTSKYQNDDWPHIQGKFDACDILIMGTSVWLGEKSRVYNRGLK
jgi:multimeric flavodoxin WrbA